MHLKKRENGQVLNLRKIKVGKKKKRKMLNIIKKFNLQLFQTYFVVCVTYFILTFTISKLLRLLEKKMDGKKNYIVFGSQTDFQAEIHVNGEE